MKHLYLGILLSRKPGIYHINPVFQGKTDKETANNIAAVYNISLRIGTKDLPLDRYEIPSEKIKAVKSLVQTELAHAHHTAAIEAATKEETSIIKVWDGYLSDDQQRTIPLSHIRNESKDGPYQISFDKLNEAVNFALDNNKKTNIVTILPANKLSTLQKEKLETAKAHVLYMNLDKDEPGSEDIVQLEAMIATGAAYLTGNELAFRNLYRLLTEQDIEIGVTIQQLKITPEEAINFIFQLKPIQVENYNDRVTINKRMKKLLSSA